MLDRKRIDFFLLSRTVCTSWLIDFNMHFQSARVCSPRVIPVTETADLIGLLCPALSLLARPRCMHNARSTCLNSEFPDIIRFRETRCNGVIFHSSSVSLFCFRQNILKISEKQIFSIDEDYENCRRQKLTEWSAWPTRERIRRGGDFYGTFLQLDVGRCKVAE